MDTRRLNFCKEAILKEATVRLDWHLRYSKEFSQKDYQPRPRKVEFIQPNIDFSKLPLIDNDRHKKRGLKMTAPPSLKTNKQSQVIDPGKLVEMRPVSPDTYKLLYKGFSALGEGRYAYLQQRKLKVPEMKYSFPISSSWEYGWKIKEAMKNPLMQSAEFGRSRIVKDSFYRTNGVF